MTIEMQLREYDILIDIITGEVTLENLPKDFTMGFVRSDIRANRLNIKLESNSKPYIIGDNNVKMAFRKYDKNIVVMERDVNELYVVDNIIQCTLMPEILSIINRQVLAEIIITDSEGRHLTSARFSFYVREGILDNKNIKQLSNYNILTDMQNQVENLLIDIEENILPAEEERKQAEIDRANVFEEVIGLANNTKNSLNGVVDTANDINNILNNPTNGTIKKANDINNTLSNNIDGTIKKATDIDNILKNTTTDANTAKGNLDGSITAGSTLKNNLDGDISVGTTLKDNLENNIEEGNQLKQDLPPIITSANTSKDNLDASITNANTINNTLTNETDGTIKKATNINGVLSNTISNANTINSTLSNETDGTIKRAIDSKVILENKISDVTMLKTEIEDAITDNQIVKKSEFDSKINDLEGMRIYKGMVQPDDTPFWYDTADDGGIIRK